MVVLLAGSWAPAGVAGAARADGGDIVVVTTMDGLVYALDAWSGELSGGLGPAVLFSHGRPGPDPMVPVHGACSASATLKAASVT